MEMTTELEALYAVMEQIDPATLPGLSMKQRCALGRFAKPAVAVEDYDAEALTIQQKATLFDLLAAGVDEVGLSVNGSNDNLYPECTVGGLMSVAQDIYSLQNYDPDAEDEEE